MKPKNLFKINAIAAAVIAEALRYLHLLLQRKWLKKSLPLVAELKHAL